MWIIKHILRIEICRQFIKFCLVGTLNAIVDYSVYLILSRVFSVYFLYANIAAILVAMIFSFIFNKYWTFRNHDKKIHTQTAKFVIVNLIYFLLNNSIVFALVNYLEMYDLLAKVVAIFIGTFWNFFANRYWTFKKSNL